MNVNQAVSYPFLAKLRTILLMFSLFWLIQGCGRIDTAISPSPDLEDGTITAYPSESPTLTMTQTMTQTTTPVPVNPIGTIIYSDMSSIYAVDLQQRDFRAIRASGPESMINYSYVLATSNLDLYARLDDFYSMSRNYSGNIYRIQMNPGAGVQQITFTNGFPEYSISPDEAYLAYTDGYGSDTDPAHVSVINLIHGGGNVVLTETETDSFIYFKTLSWSSDSQSLAYARTGNWGENVRVTIANLATNELIDLAPNGTIVSYQPAWSPSDDSLLLGMKTSDSSIGIYLVNVKTGTTTLVVATDDMPENFHWSPNVNQVVFEYRPQSNDDKARLCLLDMDTFQILTIQEGGAESPFNFNPLWSPDGADIAYFTEESGGLQLNIYHVESGGRFKLKLPGNIALSRLGGSWISSSITTLQVENRYIVTAAGDNTKVFDSPQKEPTEMETLHSGDIVTIIGGPTIFGRIWRQIRTEEGLDGWIVEMPGTLVLSPENPTSSPTP